MPEITQTQLSDVKTLRKDPILALPGDGVRIGHTGREKFDLEPKALQWS